ncbi:hypothetical protein SAMN05444000_10322 [Shimia gijangensis]|uniref:Uncharacterized protein n=1 Tax=Shimia gijangensis TaxID=1470563 RepID=A0A1M6DW44_9RHOB|nr:hypothetical protein SAMN05444000_10322 [Shimia gijangensis]
MSISIPEMHCFFFVNKTRLVLNRDNARLVGASGAYWIKPKSHKAIVLILKLMRLQVRSGSAFNLISIMQSEGRADWIGTC